MWPYERLAKARLWFCSPPNAWKPAAAPTSRLRVWTEDRKPSPTSPCQMFVFDGFEVRMASDAETVGDVCDQACTVPNPIVAAVQLIARIALHPIPLPKMRPLAFMATRAVRAGDKFNSFMVNFSSFNSL